MAELREFYGASETSLFRYLMKKHLMVQSEKPIPKYQSRLDRAIPQFLLL